MANRALNLVLRYLSVSEKNALMTRIIPLQTKDRIVYDKITSKLTIPKYHIENQILDQYLTILVEKNTFNIEWLKKHNSRWPQLLVKRAIVLKKIIAIEKILTLCSFQEKLECIASLSILDCSKLSGQEMEQLITILNKHRRY